ncbi:hypothetical protein [Rhodoferax sp. PAMC 29310]|uniref:hypothetical protein n=1 Tax=Rhodoferax sp. PAMC 29310 TaxID=2822760 RepID=UPI001B327405|nr:hypothetical protein [Rhodoferax sp. PAMC 29310]
MLDARVPDLVVIDEAFAMVCLQKIEFNISLLRHPSLPEEARNLCAEVARVLQGNHPLHPLITTTSKRNGGLLAAVAALRTSAPRPQPTQSDHQVLEILQSAPNFEPIAKFFEHLKQACAAKLVLQSIAFDAATGVITVHHRNDITRFKSNSSNQQSQHIYLLDATASREITEVFFPGARFKEFRAKRKAYVIQCRSSKCSKRSITPANHTTPQSQADATLRLSEIQKLIDELSANHQSLLVVGPAAVTGNPSRNTPSLVTAPPHSALAHFGALRGVDMYKHFDSVLVIGRNEPPTQAVQDLARAMFYDAAVPLKLSDYWISQPKAYQLKSNPEGVDVDCHIDQRVQAILMQIREAESLQAIDRLRLIHCIEPKLVVLLSNIPLDLEVDALLTWDELIYGNRLEQAWRGAGLVMPLVPGWLSANHNDLWSTPAAAKKDVQRLVQKGQITNRFSIRKMSPFTFEYRASGQRRASSCLSRVSDPVAVSGALSGILGFPVRVTGPLPSQHQ